MALSMEPELVLLGLLIATSAFFAAVELSVFSMSNVKVRKLVAEKRRNAVLLDELKKHPQELLSTILVCNNLVNVASASIATALTLQIYPGDLGIAIATGAITLAILIFGEITPKSLALKHNETIALFAAPLLKVLVAFFSPLIFVLNSVTGFFVRILGGEGLVQMVTEDEVKTVVALSAEEGSINRQEKEMIHRIFKLNDIVVEEIMVPRSEIFAIESGTKVRRLDTQMLQHHSRIPVYGADLDEVIGIFYVRDLLDKKFRGKPDLVVDKMMKPPLFVYSNKKIDKLLRELQRKKNHMAIVVDEYGGTVGLVTIEDILEEIVGEIMDESDVEHVIKKVKPNEFLVEGQATLDELGKKIGVPLKSEEYDTVAGYIIGAMDRVPKPKDYIVVSNVKFAVEKMDGPKIEWVRVYLR